MRKKICDFEDAAALESSYTYTPLPAFQWFNNYSYSERKSHSRKKIYVVIFHNLNRKTEQIKGWGKMISKICFLNYYTRKEKDSRLIDRQNLHNKAALLWILPACKLH